MFFLIKQVIHGFSLGLIVTILLGTDFSLACMIPPVRDLSFYLSQRMTEPTKWKVRPAKTDQPGHLPSLIRVFAVRLKKVWVLGYLLSADRIL